MGDTPRETRLNEAFVALADTLVTGYDVIDLLDTLLRECVQIFDVDAGGILLRSPTGELTVVASTSERADFVELMQLDAGAGPCIECIETGVTVTVADIDEIRSRWPAFHTAALSKGYRSVHATPLRLRTETIGAMNLFSTEQGGLSERDIAASRALADVATIGILQERAIHDVSIVSGQLQHALNSRVLIEQAKGVLSQLGSVDMDQAFTALRNHARSRSLPLRAVAMGVIDRTIEIDGILSSAPPATRPR